MTTQLSQASRHIPVMLAEVLAAIAPRDGETYVDGTFGAGGYSRAVLETAACKVIAIDRDPNAIRDGQAMVQDFSGRLQLLHGAFSEMSDLLDEIGVASVDGVMLDIGVSSMQLDEAPRGFSFMRDGPLDMRMSQEGPSAADHVNTMDADDLARVIYILGEEPKSRAIARAIVKAREEQPITTTLELVRAIERATGPQRMKDRTHPATRTFQALRIFVNAELDELASVLHQAELLLREGGRLVVVSFHSLEDRIVKRFLQSRSGKTSGGSRYQPELQEGLAPSFTLPVKGHISASDEEGAINPRSRSAKLRVGIRTSNAAWPFSFEELGMRRVEGV